MPVLLAENVVQLEFQDLWKRRPIDRPDRPLARAEGHHQSQILAHVARKVGWLKPDERDESEFPLIWALGQAVEEYTFSFYPEIIWQPGERIVDGIAMNCDGICRSGAAIVLNLNNTTLNQLVSNPQPYRNLSGDLLEECKATYKSVASGDEFIRDKKWKVYEHQGREYCYGYGPRVVRWHVWHLNGDYRSFGPVYKQYVVGFSDKEVEQTHALLLKYKDEVEPESGVA